MATLQFKAIKLEGPPPHTISAQCTHKRELVYPTDWLTQHRYCKRRLTVVHSPTGQSSMKGWWKLSFPTLKFLLSSGVSCVSIPSTNVWSFVQGSNWNSAISLFLTTPLTAGTPNLCLRVCGTPYCRGEQWTVDSTEWLTYATVPYVNPTWQICNYNVCQMAQMQVSQNREWEKSMPLIHMHL